MCDIKPPICGFYMNSIYSTGILCDITLTLYDKAILYILGLQPHNPELRQFSQLYTPWLGCFSDFLFGQCYLPPDLRQKRGCFSHCVPCGPFSVALRILVGLPCPLLPHPSYLCWRMFAAFGSQALSLETLGKKIAEVPFQLCTLYSELSLSLASV